MLKKALFALLLPFAVLLSNCNKQQQGTDDQIPNIPVSIAINVTLPLYLNLQTPGNFIYLEGGSKGIVLYHAYDGQYYAMDRNCPYQPLDDCAKVTVEKNNLFARCGKYENDTTFVPCCGSRFDLAGGFLMEGPARYPLKNYYVNKSGDNIYINN